MEESQFSTKALNSSIAGSHLEQPWLLPKEGAGPAPSPSPFQPFCHPDASPAKQVHPQQHSRQEQTPVRSSHFKHGRRSFKQLRICLLLSLPPSLLPLLPLFFSSGETEEGNKEKRHLDFLLPLIHDKQPEPNHW